VHVPDEPIHTAGRVYRHCAKKWAWQSESVDIDSTFTRYLLSHKALRAFIATLRIAAHFAFHNLTQFIIIYKLQ